MSVCRVPARERHQGDLNAQTRATIFAYPNRRSPCMAAPSNCGGDQSRRHTSDHRRGYPRGASQVQQCERERGSIFRQTHRTGTGETPRHIYHAVNLAGGHRPGYGGCLHGGAITTPEYNRQAVSLVTLARVAPVEARGRVYAELHASLWYGLVREQQKFGRDWLSGHLYCLLPRLVEEWDGRVTVLSYAKRLIAWTAPRHQAKERSAVSIPLDPGQTARREIREQSFVRSSVVDSEEFAALLERAQLELAEDEDSEDSEEED